jgi:hypothetical protein
MILTYSTDPPKTQLTWIWNSRKLEIKHNHHLPPSVFSKIFKYELVPTPQMQIHIDELMQQIAFKHIIKAKP